MVHILAIDRGLECKGDIGWWLDPRLRGAGLATEAVRLATQFALRPQLHAASSGLGLLRVVAAITKDNGPSRRLAAKAGYVQDAHATCGIEHQGVWKTHELWHADA
jgi:RimJ/RimL family protein N-acetyltransferase